ncbi:MAG: hypothetical protein FH749_14045 [Firmicutes bacterium]|nr:hypothetical protein [Bacillota bacterium]
MKKTISFICLSLIFMLCATTIYASADYTNHEIESIFLNPVNVEHYLNYLEEKGVSFDNLIEDYTTSDKRCKDYFMIEEYLSGNTIGTESSINTIYPPIWTKKTIRAAIVVAAESYKNSAPFAHRLLIHSLQDNPATYYARWGDGGANRQAIEQIRSHQAYKNAGENQLVTFSSPNNLYLSLNNCTKRITRTPTLYREYLYDYYDFEWNQSSGWSETIVNLAVIAQSLGAINNYHVYVYVLEEFWDGVSPWPWTLPDLPIQY